jgi:hypothetical protein
LANLFKISELVDCSMTEDVMAAPLALLPKTILLQENGKF